MTETPPPAIEADPPLTPPVAAGGEAGAFSPEGWRLVKIVVATLLVMLYCLPNYGYYSDAIADAGDVLARGWPQRLHPHHLGSSTIYWALWKLLTGIGIAIKPFGVLTLVGRLAALGICWQTWRLLQKQGLPETWALAGTLLTGFSFTLWNYATTGATYAPAVFCALMVYGELLDWAAEGVASAAPSAEGVASAAPSVKRGSGSSPRPGSRPWRLAGWLILGTLFHQLAILALLPAMWWIWLQERSPRGVVRIALSVSLSLAMMYYAAAAFVTGTWVTLGELYKWATLYGHQEQWWIWSHIPEDTSPLAYWVAVVSESHGRLAWALPFGEKYEALTIDSLGIACQQLLPSDVANQWVYTYWWIALALLIAGGWSLKGEDAASQRPWRRLAFGWSLPFVVFSAFFAPENSFYRLYYLPALLLLLLGPLVVNRGWYYRLGIPVMALFFVLTLILNMGYGWFPRSIKWINPRLVQLTSLELLDRGPIAVSRAPDWQPLIYMQYFLERPVYRAQWYSEAEHTPKLQTMESREAELARRWMEAEGGAPSTAPLEERLAEGRRHMATLGEKVWLYQNVIDWRGRLSAAAPDEAHKPRYLRLFRAQQQLKVPDEIWLDMQDWELLSAAEGGPYRLWGFVPLGSE